MDEVGLELIDQSAGVVVGGEARDKVVAGADPLVLSGFH